jgi:hypothetical protein
MIQVSNEYRGAANTYMDKVAKEKTFTDVHKGYTVVPHKIHRCFGLSQYERLIMIDLLAYMGDKSKCFPTQETIARNIGCSSKSVERHLKSLAQKHLILISGTNRNNEYYLPNDLHEHPYLLLSEKTHEFIASVRQSVNERELTNWVEQIVKSEKYKEFITKLEKVFRSPLPFGREEEVKAKLTDYMQFLKTQFLNKFGSTDSVSN